MRRVYTGYRTIAVSNTAQPLVSTTTSAAIPAGATSPNIVPVGDTTIFDQGTWVIVDTSTNEERALIVSIAAGVSVTLQVPGGTGDIKGCQKVHASGVIIRPARMCSKISVQGKDGNAAALFLGTGSAAKNDGTLTFWELVQVAGGQQPAAYEESFMEGNGDNPIDIAEYWIVGTNPDKYLVSILVA